MSWCLLALLFAAPSPAQLVPLASDQGLQRLARSDARVDFPHLANEFEPQENRAFCGVASSVIVLNALRDRNPAFEKPEDPRLVPPSWGVPANPAFDPLFPRYSQGNFFTPAAEAIKRRDEVLGQPRRPLAHRDPGLQLRQLALLLDAHGLRTELHVANEQTPAAEIRSQLIANLQHENDYVLVNYSRSAAGQSGGGHISPLGAYDSGSDSFLVLDVNPNHEPWVWMTAEVLIGAMKTKDVVENRGYLLVREGAGPKK